jgi:hypothetical protein
MEAVLNEDMLAEEETDALVNALRRHGIRCQYSLGFLEGINAEAGYWEGVVYRHFDTSLENFIHEVGHAIDDLNGTLDKNDRRTGELVACCFTELFFRDNIVTGFFFGYLKYLMQLYLVPEYFQMPSADILSGARRALAAVKHSLAKELKDIVDAD